MGRGGFFLGFRPRPPPSPGPRAPAPGPGRQGPGLAGPGSGPGVGGPGPPRAGAGGRAGGKGRARPGHLGAGQPAACPGCGLECHFIFEVLDFSFDATNTARRKSPGPGPGRAAGRETRYIHPGKPRVAPAPSIVARWHERQKGQRLRNSAKGATPPFTKFTKPSYPARRGESDLDRDPAGGPREGLGAMPPCAWGNASLATGSAKTTPAGSPRRLYLAHTLTYESSVVRTVT